MKVKFVPQNIEFDVKPGESVLHLAQDNNIHIRSVCRGVPSCAECRVRVVAGESNVISPSKTELGLIGTAYFVDGRRLSCQLRCFGDITVDLTEQIETQGATKKMRGKYNKDEMQESRAVMGNLIMNDEPKNLEDPNITPVTARDPDGVPTSKEDEIDVANDAHEAHLAKENSEEDFGDEDDSEDGDDQSTSSPQPQHPTRRSQPGRPGQPGPAGARPRAPQGGQRPQNVGGTPSEADASGEGGVKKRRRRRGGRGRRGGTGGPAGGAGPSGGGSPSGGAPRGPSRPSN